MKRNPSRQALGLAVGLALAGPLSLLSAQSQPDQSAPELTNAGALFLLLPVGAQGVGMGQVGVTLQGRGEAVFWNPAGLATMTSSEFTLNSASLVAGPTTAITMFLPRHGIGVFGLGVYLVDYGEEDVQVDSTFVLAHIAPRNLEYLASFATSVAGGVTVGMTYKLVQFDVNCSGNCTGLPSGSNALTHAFDVGAQVTVGSGGALRLGAVVKNIGFKLQVNNAAQADPLPARLTLGALYRIDFRPVDAGPGPSLALPDSGKLGLQQAINQVDLRLAADLDRPWDNSAPPEMRVGIDLGYHELIRLRSGYAFTRQGLSGPTVGMGIHTGSIALDFARTFVSGTDLLATNPTFVSFSLLF
jgi:hypothetical protein